MTLVFYQLFSWFSFLLTSVIHIVYRSKDRPRGKLIRLSVGKSNPDAKDVVGNLC